MAQWTREGSSLVLAGERVVLRTPAGERSCSAEELRSGALHTEVCNALDHRTLAEALAWLEERASPPSVKAPAGRDPQELGVLFDWSLGRGGGGAAWVLGRTVRVSLVGRTIPDRTVEQLAQEGFTAEERAGLPPGWAAQLEQSARQLAPLRCYCATSFEQFRHHDALRTLSYVQDPRAPIECVAQVGRCAVCGRAWTLVAMGDPHYSYTFERYPCALPE